MTSRLNLDTAVSSPALALPVDIQTANEYSYSRKHVDGYIRTAILSNPEMLERIQEGVTDLRNWMGETYYPSKDARLAQLKELDLEALVISLFVNIAHYQKPELFTAVTGQLAGRLGWSDQADAITTIAEVLAILCATDVFDIDKPARSSSLMLVSCIPLPENLKEAIGRAMYLPPMVCPPEIVRDNYTGPYLTFKDSLILGRGNTHDGDICLDVINTQNQIPLKLDTDFLSSVEELPNKPPEGLEQELAWEQFKYESYQVYNLMVRQGNQFYLTNKVDKRGRLYAQGYHITSQGSSFKKAMIELANEELVTGVPT